MRDKLNWHVLELVIPVGRAHAISRTKLAEKLKLPDRYMRRMIAAAQRDGMIICNDQDGRGYYQPQSVADIERAYKQERSRALATLVKLKTMRQQLKNAGRNV